MNQSKYPPPLYLSFLIILYTDISAFFLSLLIFCDRQEAAAAIQEGQQQFQVLKRQATIGKLYPSAASVMDSPSI